ncbi:cob(I)yrinic acid a,c-diamide adenosyltransferase [Natranaeroarchaeum aerophilus]|uniref:Cob(I)yrinic acid a,c-diamide adenosyltransferase n=1 Tax=Natranaeroarchaeum aerophilus TaxID=2917711 RepID=A0AAE3FRU5_9EURY|nr:cob(I)yrinic acid a,c-diamide adenosyltransferase [Natranaeroarchaeum aerophilus]MCL9814477.1 cob(I)yrinic acid a,c-diamide adenosyltransferase [Natranaeroarchaeum aerophilus]
MTDDIQTDDDGDSEGPTLGGRKPTAQPIEPSEPDEFGLVQVWWGDGKGKTTAAMGMGLRAAGHGYRVHMLQFMKGGAETVEDVRGEYNAIEHIPGFTYENAGHYGWHGFGAAGGDPDHDERAQAAFERAGELIMEGIDGEDLHMLILDEILYAADRELVDPEGLLDLLERAPDELELVLTGSHEEPTYLLEHADLVTEVGKVKHPIDVGQAARKGTEY